MLGQATSMMRVTGPPVTPLVAGGNGLSSSLAEEHLGSGHRHPFGQIPRKHIEPIVHNYTARTRLSYFYKGYSESSYHRRQTRSRREFPRRAGIRQRHWEKGGGVKLYHNAQISEGHTLGGRR